MHARTFAIGSRRAARRSGIGMENCLQKSPTAERIDGYRVTLVRSDVFEKIRTLQKQQKPRIGAKELVTALLQAVLESPNATKLALKLVRAQRAEQLRREAACLRCVVRAPEMCKALLPPLPAVNPMILGWAPSAV